MQQNHKTVPVKSWEGKRSAEMNADGPSLPLNQACDWSDPNNKQHKAPGPRTAA